MEDYVGKICPYCKTTLQDGDDIVVCSVCGMPHHRDCWDDNHGCTTFGCSGTIRTSGSGDAGVPAAKIVYSSAVPASAPQPVPNSYIFCTRCGAQNLAGSSFCSRCGSPLRQPQAPANTVQPYTAQTSYSTVPAQYGSAQTTYAAPQTTYTSGQASCQSTSQYGQNYGYNSQYDTDMNSDLALLVSTNKDYYIPRFNKMKSQNTQISWNWCAFLVTPFWMIYRKMYAYGAAVIGIGVLCTLLGSIFRLVPWAVFIAAGLLGNHIYMNFLEAKTGQISMLTGTYKSDYAARIGGTSTSAVVLSVVIYLVAILALTVVPVIL